MSIPGNEKPGAFSGEQQQQSIHLDSAIPIKKRRFLPIQPESPAPEEKAMGSVSIDSKKKQESSIPSAGLPRDDGKSTATPGNSDMSKTLPFVLKKEVTTTSIELGKANAGILASKLLEAKPPISLGMDKFWHGMNVLSNEIHSVKGVPESFRSPMTKHVKQEIISEKAEGSCRAQPSTSLMNVELSLGQKDPLLCCQNNEAGELKPQKVDPSLLSLGPTKEKLVLRDNNVSTVDNASSQVSVNRSNWDLNTTMDAWEGSVNSDACTPGVVGIGGFSKAYSCSSVVSSLTTAGMYSLSLGKGKHTSDDRRSSSSNPTVQCKNNVSLGLGLDMPGKEQDASMKCSSLVVKSASTSGTPSLNLKPVLQSFMNMNQAVKSETVDENINHDHSIGSCNSSNMGLSKSVSVKREQVNSNSLKIVLPSFVGSDRAAGGGSIKSEMVEGNQEARKSDSAILAPSIVRVGLHQESSASSSALPVSSMPQCSHTSGLPTPSNLTMSGNLSSQSQNSLPVKTFHGSSDSPDKQIANMVSKHVSQDEKHSNLHKLGNTNLQDHEKSKLARIEEYASESCRSGENAEDFDEMINISTKRFEDSFGSDCKSKENCAIGKTLKATGENVRDKEDEECEDSEVQEHLRHLAGKNLIVEGKKMVTLQCAGFVSRNLQPSVSCDQNISAFDFVEKVTGNKIHDESGSDAINNRASISCEPQSANNSSQKVSGQVLEATVDEKRSVLGVNAAKNVYSNGPTNGSSGADNEQGDDTSNKFGTEIWSRKNSLTWSKTEVSLNRNDAAKDCNGAGNKSRIINLALTSVVTPPAKTRSIPNKLLTSRFGKQRYSNHGREFQPQVNRDEIYTGGSNKFAKERVHDQFHRNSRPGFMRGKGRISDRFGSLRREWDPDHDLMPKTYDCPSDCRAVGRRNTSNISDVELEFDDYSIPQDATALVNTRRKTMTNEFHSVRRHSSRLSPGDRDRTVPRGMPMMHRRPRNMSPSQCTIEDGSNMMGLRHGEKVMRDLSDDMIDPVCNSLEPMYENFDSQFARGNRNFPSLHRKGYPRGNSKSPVRSRTRSPGPWQSPRRRSPNGPPEVNQHRSTTLYRVGRLRSPDHACFHEEIVARRREPASYIARHPNDFRDVESGRDLVHPRPPNLNRRSSPSRVFPRIGRRVESTLDSREMGNGDEFINAPLHTSKFHELRDDGTIDDRRKFVDRLGPPSFHPNYRGGDENFHFHQDSPRPYRFCADMDTEFVNRSNVWEREFDGHTKHHRPMGGIQRVRNIEEQIEQVWHDDGFCETRGKRRRY